MHHCPSYNEHDLVPFFGLYSQNNLIFHYSRLLDLRDYFEFIAVFGYLIIFHTSERQADFGAPSPRLWIRAGLLLLDLGLSISILRFTRLLPVIHH
jgi:hypothetical protein